jgi:hypothetical protein
MSLAALEAAIPQRRHGRACPGHPRLCAERLKQDADAREDGVPAASRGGVSLRGHDGPMFAKLAAWTS